MELSVYLSEGIARYHMPVFARYHKPCYFHQRNMSEKFEQTYFPNDEIIKMTLIKGTDISVQDIRTYLFTRRKKDIEESLLSTLDIITYRLKLVFH